MANKKRTNQTQLDAVPTPEVSSIETVEQDWVPSESSLRYVVTRGGLRVSDREYPSVNEPNALAEKEFWQKIVSRWPDGTKIEIVQYDKKKHRIW